MFLDLLKLLFPLILFESGVFNCFIFATADDPVFHIHSNANINRMGNIHGRFLYQLGAYYLSGAHLQPSALNHGIDLKPSHNNSRVFAEYFFKGIPQKILNNHPASSKQTVVSNLRANFPKVDSEIYPWEYYAPVVSMFPLWHQINSACNASLLFHSHLQTTLYIPKEGAFHDEPSSVVDSYFSRDIKKIPINQMNISSLPMFPDVVIHYRCGEALFATNIGVMQFQDILENIPQNVKYIMIIAQARDQRGFESKYWSDVFQVCSNIVDALATDIITQFPEVTIIIRRGTTYSHIF